MNKILSEKFQNESYDIMYEFIENIDVRVEIGKLVKKIQARPSRSDKGKISYLRNGKRMQLSIRRFLTRILHLNDHLSDVQLDDMAGKILETCKMSNYTFEYLTGDDIQIAYRNRIGGGSCMTGDYSEYMRMYADNPDRIKLAVVRYNNSSSRCIIWLGDDKKLYYDRIYSDSPYCFKTLEKELSDQDVTCIYEEDVPVTVSDLNYTRGEIPYLDTMYRGTFSDDKLTLKSSGVSGPCDEVLQDQHGNSESSYICYYCECEMNGDETYRADDINLCENCYCENYTMCGHCREIHHNDEITHVQSNNTTYCNSCLSDECFTCDGCNEIFHRNDINCEGDDTLCETCYDENYSECKYCKETTHKDDMENENMCKDCASDFIICPKCDVVSDKYIADNGVCADCNGMFAKV